MTFVPKAILSFFVLTDEEVKDAFGAKQHFKLDGTDKELRFRAIY